MAVEQDAPAGPPNEPRSAGAQPRPWQPSATRAQLDLVRRWQRILRADAGKFRTTQPRRRASRGGLAPAPPGADRGS